MKTYLAVVDLEATCCDYNSFPRHEMETIEIGLVLVDLDTKNTVGEFQRFIKPVRHPKLTDFCKALTTIDQVRVDRAATYPVVLEQLKAFLDGYSGANIVFCSWGFYDKKQLKQDCDFHKANFPFSEAHINLKEEFAKNQNLKKSIGVGFALNKCDLDFIGQQHRGIDDARNIARLLPWCIDTRKIGR